MVGPADQRAVVGLLITEEGSNVSRACMMAGLSRSTFRYRRKPRDDDFMAEAELQGMVAAVMPDEGILFPMGAKDIRKRAFVFNG